jgi:Fe2+ or Zn2+ uptake regulation protein
MADVHATAGERLRLDKQRYTEGRRAIVAALVAADGPQRVDELLEACAGLAQSSAYRNLAVLERTGVIRRVVALDDFARYELAEDLTEHHHHLVCEVCGRIEDFTIPAPLEADLEDCLDSVASRFGFDGLSHQLDLVGVCDRCRN